MKGNMEERACALAAYIIENRATVRAAAKKFGVSKSTVHTVDTLSVGSIWCLISRRDRTKGGMLSMSVPPFYKEKKNERENSTVPPAASPAILPLSQNSRTPPKKSADALRSVADHNAAHTLRSMGGHCFFAASLWSGGGTGDERRGTRDGSRLHSPTGPCQTSFSHTTAFNRRSMSKKEVFVYA